MKFRKKGKNLPKMVELHKHFQYNTKVCVRQEHKNLQKNLDLSMFFMYHI